MKPTYEELEARVSELSKALDVSLRVQADQAKRMGQILLEIKRSEAVVGSLGWMGLDTAISLELSKLNEQISDLQGQVRALTEQRDALAVENVGMKSAISAVNQTAEECELNGDEVKYVVGTPEFEALMDLLDETQATEAASAALRAEGVEMLMDSLSELERGVEDTIDLMHYCSDFARQLRESKGANHE